MTDVLSTIVFPVQPKARTQEDIVRQAEEQQRWWREQSARLLGDDNVESVATICPVKVMCALTGEVVRVSFDPGSKAHMTDKAIGEALHNAAGQVKFEAPQFDPDLTDEQLAAACKRRTDEVIRWLHSAVEPADSAQRREGISSGGEVSVVYAGARLIDIRVLRRDWALLYSESQIEAAIIEASRRALASSVYWGSPTARLHSA